MFKQTDEKREQICGIIHSEHLEKEIEIWNIASQMVQYFAHLG